MSKQSFAQQLLTKLQSAVLITVSILATVGCLSLGTFATTRTVDWARGVEKGTTYNQLKSVVTDGRFLNTAAYLTMAYAANYAESSHVK